MRRSEADRVPHHHVTDLATQSQLLQRPLADPEVVGRLPFCEKDWQSRMIGRAFAFHILNLRRKIGDIK
jgi:hypothetical protein